MRLAGLLLFTCLFSVALFSQQNNNGAANVAKTVDPSAEKERDTDEESFSKAVVVGDAYLRIDALKTFLSEYPESTLRVRAIELLSSARATAADIELRGEQPEKGVALFKLAVNESPDPPSDDLFSKVLVNIPTNLFLLGKRDAAFELAEMIESKAGSNPKQLLRLATFYIAIKYATGTRRLAQKAIEIDPSDPLSYQTLGAANRLGFDLNGAEAAYAKALELQPDSLAARQYLGEMKRALGQPEAAEKLFREILEKEPSDLPARTGLILSLFDQNRRNEAEALFAEEVSDNGSNAFVMIGAANWYVAHDEPDLALESANNAIAVDPSSVWAYIAIGRAYMKKNDPVEAEKFLLAGLKYGSSPTLAYELALARSALGFYFEAAQTLSEHVRVENGMLVTDLDGRIGVEAANLSDLVSLERKNAIFLPADSYDPVSAAKLKTLLVFEEAVNKKTEDDPALEAAVTDFIGETDQMQTFRSLYAATRLLDHNKLPAKAQEIAQKSVNGVEDSVNVDNAAAPVMAEQLYEGRKAAEGIGRMLLIPVVEKATLIKILRGRIEDISARSMIASEDYQGAEVRLKRAATVFPKDSVWWRSSLWRLGSVYEKLDKDKLALDNYVTSYTNGEPTLEKRNTIEAVYTRIHGSLAGLDQMLETTKKPEPSAASMFVKAAPQPEKKVVQPEAAVEQPADEVVVQDPVLKEDVDLSLVAEPADKVVTEDIKPAETGVKSTDSSVTEESKDEVAADIKLLPALDPAKTDSDETSKPGPATALEPADTEVKKVTETPADVQTSDLSAEPKPEDNPKKDDDTAVEPLDTEAKKVTEIPADVQTLDLSVAPKPEDDPVKEDDVPLEPEDSQEKKDTDKSADVQVSESEVQAKPVDEVSSKEVAPANDSVGVTPKPDETRKTRIVPQVTTDSDKDDSESDLSIVPPKVDTPSDAAVGTPPASSDKLPVDEDKTDAEKSVTEKTDTLETVSDKAAPDVVVTKKTDTEILLEKNDKALIDLGATRPRFVPKEKIKVGAVTAAAKPCSVVSSQDSISLIANGGSLGIVVGVLDYEKAYVMRARSNSPKDVSIVYEPDIGSVDGRAFFVIKSVSEKKGTYNVVFETPCGDKSVTVEVH